MESHEGQFYDALATLYNQDWGTVYLDTAREQFKNYVAPHLAAGARILDVCCGTGQMAASLTAEGYVVTGVDLSPGMVEFAKVNAPESELVLGEMSAFALGRRFDAAMCCFNSLNHARGVRHLTRTLKNIRRHLVPGGYFMADLVLAEGYANSWNRTATVDVPGGECQLLFRYEPNRQRAYCDATLRLEGEAEIAVRMRQHVFSPTDLYQAGQASGMAVRGIYPIPGDPPTGRVLFLTQVN